MNEDTTGGLITGLFLGWVTTLFFWIITAELTEQAKVTAGYLTYCDKVYSVTLYDTLDTPPKNGSSNTTVNIDGNISRR